MADPSVLVLSHDSLLAALLGLAVELAGGRACFVAPGERDREVLLRLRPALVLVDADDASCNERFLGPALMTGARVTILRTPRARGDVDGLAQRLGARELRLPLDADALATLLREALD
jgi:hypothetical protein